MNGKGANSIYLFDRESGHLQRRIKGLPNVIVHLDYSPDAKYLAVSLAGNINEVRLYETSNYQLIGKDTNYSNRSHHFDFDSSSKHLVTSSSDGFLRLYEINEEQLRLVKKQRVIGSNDPRGVKFSPDGASIAVGFQDTIELKVVSAADLSILYTPVTDKVSNGNLPYVAWSSDGRTLFAAGTIGNTKGLNPICYWTNEGRNFNETAASISSVTDIQPLSTGGVVFGATGPTVWGVLDANGRRTTFVDSMSADFRNSQILANEDLTQIRFSYERRDGQPAFYSLPQRKLESGKIEKQNLKSAKIESSKLDVVDWIMSREPSVNGQRLHLQDHEVSYSLAILPDEKTFLLGTGWFLRKYDKKGEELWRVTVPAIAWNINSNSTLSIVALEDGTIRWYRTSDGQELLAFFSPKDKSNRWILWTPSGYYDASPGAEDLIGWHVNNGIDAAADFFPNHLFRAYFYRPDVIDTVLQTADETLSVKLANEKVGRKDSQLNIAKILPPVIDVYSPHVKEVSSTTAKVSYKVRLPSGEPTTSIKTFIDGREIKLSNDETKTANKITEITVQLPRKDSELTLIAENRFTKSIPVSVQFKWQVKQ